jgi:hypothetical protein
MRFDKTHLFVFLAGAILGLLSGFFSGKAIYDKPIEESVTRDTVTLHDTVPEYLPAPKDSVRTKYVTRWLPRDTSSRVDHLIVANNNNMVEHFADTSKMIPVEVPITSKHYGSKEYDAWVSGFEPSLDSIKVYQRTEYITERVTVSKPPNKWELDLVGGINYKVQEKKYTPYAGGELLYKPNRFQFGIRGGIEYTDKVEPVIGAVAKIRIY